MIDAHRAQPGPFQRIPEDVDGIPPLLVQLGDTDIVPRVLLQKQVDLVLAAAAFGVEAISPDAVKIRFLLDAGAAAELLEEPPGAHIKEKESPGLQKQAHPGKGVTIKHFAANNQEENRYFSNSHVSERALREIYLRGFQIAIREATPMSIMTSYNLLNGIHTANSFELIQSVCRDEWGYQGLVMTDWNTSQNIPAFHGIPSGRYPISASTGCVRASNDLQMPGCQKNVDDLIQAVTSGQPVDGFSVTLGDLQFCAANVIRAVLATDV